MQSYLCLQCLTAFENHKHWLLIQNSSLLQICSFTHTTNLLNTYLLRFLRNPLSSLMEFKVIKAGAYPKRGDNPLKEIRQLYKQLLQKQE